MFDPDSARSRRSVSARPPRTWDFMETLFVALLADGAYSLTSGLTLSVMLAMHKGAGALSPAQLQSLWMQGNWLGVAIVVGCPPAIAVIWIAVRMAGRDLSEYLALNWPSGREIARAFGIMFVLVMAEGMARSYTGSDPGIGHYRVVEGVGGLLILLIGGCIAGPIMEEFVVRGFMFRGWSESFVGPTGAILLTAAVWALNHTQYGWFDRFWIFVSGVALGHFRWRTNSTWLPVMIHSAMNTLSFFLAGPYN
jgi:CAAX protease family protein